MRACTSRMRSRTGDAGTSTVTWRSKRPGRSSAGSRTSMRLVAAITMMFARSSKPSISTSSWLRVCSRSSLLLMPLPRRRPTASISSMKMRQGACLRAWAKTLRTRLAPTPTIISTNSEPLSAMKATPASPATALLSIVLPVPGGPASSTPLGMVAPRLRSRTGSRRNSTISASSSLASSTPATSVKRSVGRLTSRRGMLPMLMRPPPPRPRRAMKRKTKVMISRRTPPATGSSESRVRSPSPARYPVATVRTMTTSRGTVSTAPRRISRSSRVRGSRMGSL